MGYIYDDLMEMNIPGTLQLLPLGAGDAKLKALAIKYSLDLHSSPHFAVSSHGETLSFSMGLYQGETKWEIIRSLIYKILSDKSSILLIDEQGEHSEHETWAVAISDQQDYRHLIETSYLKYRDFYLTDEEQTFLVIFSIHGSFESFELCGEAIAWARNHADFDKLREDT